MAFDYKKEYKEFYLPKAKPEVVMVPEMRFVAVQGTGDVRVLLPENGNPFVSYPNPFRQRVNIEYSGIEQIVSAYLTDLSGRREEVRLQPQGNGRYTLDLTSRPQATYLLTLVTQGGQQHVVRLMKMSDIFGN